jgi:tetratricopeptide (TPR) repeat protein
MISLPRIIISFIAVVASLAAAEESRSIERGRDLFERGQLEEAARALEASATNPDRTAEANFWLGEIALQRNETEKAVARFELSVALAPEVSRYHHRLGDAYGRAAQKAFFISALGLARKCLSAYQRAVALDPKNLDARYSLFLFYLNAPRIIGGGIDHAAAEAHAIQAVDPDRGRTALIALHVKQKKLDAARTELAEARPIDLASMQGHRADLSDVTWRVAQVGSGEPSRNLQWFDGRSASDIVLIVHGRLYAKGLPAPAPSRFVFALEGGWRVFTATVGLQEGSSDATAAVFVVRGDGRELFRSRALPVETSQRVKIEVTGVSELELLTEAVGGKGREAKAIWAAPMVRR